MIEYHRHATGDVVQGEAARCIDPDAGAEDVVVMTPAELAARLAQKASKTTRVLPPAEGRTPGGAA